LDSSHASLMLAMVERINLGLIVLDQDLKVRYWNELVSQCSGKSLAQAEGHAFISVFPEADNEYFHQVINQASGQDELNSLSWEKGYSLIQLPFRPPEEKLMPVQSWQLFPFVSEDRKVHYALVLQRDTDRVDTAKPCPAEPSAGGTREVAQRHLIEQLEKANNQLLQSEKMAAIGQLAAGVAHEINNPIGYVSSNLKTLTGYVKDLLRIIDSVDQAGDITELKQLKQSLEYEYIRSDVEDLIAESEDGLGRVKKIITALKDFSHIDEEKFRLADLHRGIDTTLNVVKSELKYKAEVVKEYGDLPEVECISSQINQVIMNLLVNAAHAIEEFGCITLRTGVEETWVWIEVEDTGKGMDPSLLNRIYEPFFTTKPVGRGTGLGLSLSYNIVQKHHGRIQVFSEVGRGTRFRVWLPAQQPATSDASKEIGV
jgi:two-component system NtrC family sensor kinase